MSGGGDFRERFGAQLSVAAAGLQAAAGREPARDFRVRFGADLARAAAELAAGRAPVGETRRRWRLGGAAGDFRERFALQLSGAAAALAGGRRRRARRRGRLPWLTRPIAVGLALTACAGTALAAIAIWTPLLGNQQYGYNPGASASAPPQDELDALAVLRRPQTDADRGALSQAVLTYVNDYTTGVRTAYVRLLGTNGDVAFVLVPVQLRRATASTGGAPESSAPLANALCVYAIDSAAVVHVLGDCWSLADVRDGAAKLLLDGQLFGLAPDGVTAATITFAGSAPISAAVQGNFFDVSLPASGGPPLHPTVSFGAG